MPQLSSPTPRKTALTIGNYDSVHQGHQMLLQTARKHAGNDGKVIVLCFHPHPMTTLNPSKAPPQIDPFHVRRDHLIAAGADEVIELTPTPELLAKDPESFLDQIIQDHQPDTIVEGHDFHFGHRRQGTPKILKHLCDIRGINTHILGPVKVTLTDQSIITASSSLIRWLLTHGRVRDAAFVLGRSHQLTGTVEQGQQLGRTINIPTINLKTDSFLPADAVYSGFACFGPHRIHAAINIGHRPTVQGTTRRAEAHLLNPDGSSWTPPSTMPDYNWPCTLKLVGWVRDQVRFNNLQTLQKQIHRDCTKICKTLPEPSTA